MKSFVFLSFFPRGELAFCKTIVSHFTQSDEDESHDPDFTDLNDHTQPLGTVWDFLVGVRSPGLWVTKLKVPGQHKRNRVYLNIPPYPGTIVKWQMALGRNALVLLVCRDDRETLGSTRLPCQLIHTRKFWIFQNNFKQAALIALLPSMKQTLTQKMPQSD